MIKSMIAFRFDTACPPRQTLHSLQRPCFQQEKVGPPVSHPCLTRVSACDGEVPWDGQVASRLW